jgi:hypothetical protein
MILRCSEAKMLDFPGGAAPPQYPYQADTRARMGRPKISDCLSAFREGGEEGF